MERSKQVQAFDGFFRKTIYSKSKIATCYLALHAWGKLLVAGNPGNCCSQSWGPVLQQGLEVASREVGLIEAKLSSITGWECFASSDKVAQPEGTKWDHNLLQSPWNEWRQPWRHRGSPMKSTRIGVSFLSHFWTISIHFYRDLFILSLQSIAKYRDVSVAKTTAGAWVSSAGPEVSRQRARNSAGPKAIAFCFRRCKSRWFGFIVEYRWGGKKNNFSWTGKACETWNISSIFLWFCYCSALELSVLLWLICPGSTDPRHNPNLNRDQNDPEFWYHAARKPFNKAPKMLPKDQRECNVLDMIPDFFSLWSLCCTDVELVFKDKIWIPVVFVFVILEVLEVC